MQAELARTTNDRGRRKVRAFQEHARRRVGDAGIEAAHHAGQRDRAVGVGDDQEFIGQRTVALIQGLHDFAGAGAAHADRAFQLVGVEGVHWLAEFKHHEIADIHQRADRAKPGALEFFGQPQGRSRRRIQALDHATAIARAIGASLQHDIERRFRRQLCLGNLQRIHLRAHGRSHVESHAADRKTVGAVRRQLQFETGIRQAEIRSQRGANGRIERQFEQTRRIRIHAQFLRRAQHAEGLDAAQLRGLDGDAARNDRADGGERRLQAGSRIRRAADDLHFFTAASGHLANLQAIRFRVARAGKNFGHDHAFEGGADLLHVFHFQANRGQPRGKVLARGIYRYVLAQPAFRKFHRM